MVLILRRQNLQTSRLVITPRVMRDTLSDYFVKLIAQRCNQFIKKLSSNLGQTASVCDEHELTDTFENKLIVVFITHCD